MEWLPGINCDCILRHALHPDLPMICAEAGGKFPGGRVRIHYEVYRSEDGSGTESVSEIRHLWLTALLAEPLLAPDGSWYPINTQEFRQRLRAILLEKQDIQLITRAGRIRGLFGNDHVVINSIYPEVETFEIHLSTRALRDLPLHPQHMWLDDPAAGGSLWDEAVWQPSSVL